MTAGVFLATTILVGALMIGDSVKHSLNRIALMRLGRTEFAVTSGDRYFGVQLGDKAGLNLSVKTASILEMRGLAIHPIHQLKVHDVHVLGVNDAFWKMGGTGFRPPDNESVHVSRSLAERLHVRIGDELLIKMDRPSAMPLDAPFVSEASRRVSLRLPVQTIVDDEDFGRFGLEANQMPPYNLFIPHHLLARALDLENRANLLLVAGHTHEPIDALRLKAGLNDLLQMRDVQVQIHAMDVRSGWELTSDRVFLDDALVDAAEKADVKFQRVFAYFVNAVRYADRGTPYSFVAGLDTALLPEPLLDNEILLNHWTAEDLGVQIGDSVCLDYYVISADQSLVETQAVFVVKNVLPMQGIAADHSLMPDLPGLSDAEHCRAWDPGLPVDLNRIRDKDEAYWEQYGGAPKALISITRAQALWGNRFGRCTALRFTESGEGCELQKKLMHHLSIDDFGFVLHPVKQQALQASQNAVDFGPLFMGLSFFVLAAAMILLALISVMQADHRNNEIACYKALGFSHATVLRMFLMESGIVTLLGVLTGAIGAVAYNEIMLHALGTVWRGAVGISDLTLLIVPKTVVLGSVVSWFISVCVLGIALLRRLKKTHAGLLQYRQTGHILHSRKTPAHRGGVRISALIFVLTSVGLFLMPKQTGGSAAGLFWGAGFLLIASGLFLIRNASGLVRTKSLETGNVISCFSLSWRNLNRNPLRSLCVIALLACGLFVILGVGANRLNVTQDSLKRSSGTGGFALFGEATLPVRKNLNLLDAQSEFGLRDAGLDSVSFVQMRVKPGTDASCLNLNQVLQPQILGVDPQAFIDRNAFSFASVMGGVQAANPWKLLDQKMDGMIPAIADLDVIVWSLRKEIGDTFILPSEKEGVVKLKLVAGLAGSIFQGNVLISNDAFIRHFPSIHGTNMFLIDAPFEQREAVKSTLHRFMQDFGLDLIDTEERLSAFMTVQNTYLSIFLALGGFGMLIGITGMGIVVSRNVHERRSELAILKAVGYSGHAINRILMIEHLTLLILGVLLGCVSGLIAVKPALAAGVPWLFMSATVLLILMNGWLWTWLSVRMNMRGELRNALQDE